MYDSELLLHIMKTEIPCITTYEFFTDFENFKNLFLYKKKKILIKNKTFSIGKDRSCKTLIFIRVNVQAGRIHVRVYKKC